MILKSYFYDRMHGFRVAQCLCVVVTCVSPPPPLPHIFQKPRRDASVIAPGVLSARVQAGTFAVQAGLRRGHVGGSWEVLFGATVGTRTSTRAACCFITQWNLIEVFGLPVLEEYCLIIKYDTDLYTLCPRFVSTNLVANGFQ